MGPGKKDSEVSSADAPEPSRRRHTNKWGGHAAEPAEERGVKVTHQEVTGEPEALGAPKHDERAGSAGRIVGEEEKRILKMLGGLNTLISSLLKFNQSVVNAGSQSAPTAGEEDAENAEVTKLCNDLESTVSTVAVYFRARGPPGRRIENGGGTYKVDRGACLAGDVGAHGSAQATRPEVPDESKTEESVVQQEAPAVRPEVPDESKTDTDERSVQQDGPAAPWSVAPMEIERRPSCETDSVVSGAAAAGASVRTGPNSPQVKGKTDKWEMPDSKLLTRGTKNQPYRTPDGWSALSMYCAHAQQHMHHVNAAATSVNSVSVAAASVNSLESEARLTPWDTARNMGKASAR